MSGTALTGIRTRKKSSARLPIAVSGQIFLQKLFDKIKTVCHTANNIAGNL